MARCDHHSEYHSDCPWCKAVNPRSGEFSEGVFTETESLPPGPMVVGDFTHDGTEIVQKMYGCAMEDIGAGEEGRVMLNPREAAQAKQLGFNNFVESPDVQIVEAINMRLVPYKEDGTLDHENVYETKRWCCNSTWSQRHEPRCGTNFFAEGQTVVRYDELWQLRGPRHVVREDNVSSDRTFENETRLH